MFQTLAHQFKNVSHSQRYWFLYIFTGLTLLAVALFYQYVFDEQPCVVCIQVRLWISLFVLVSFAGLLSRYNKMVNTAAHISIVLIAIGLTERSYLLLGTERGFIFSDCGFDLGLPSWLAIDEWLPWAYRIETSCGYTPEIIFGITMAETLIVLSVCLLLISSCVSLASFIKIKN